MVGVGQDTQLRRTESCGGRQVLRQKRLIKAPHQLVGTAVIDVPERADDTVRSSVKKCPRQSVNAFPGD